jgi:hypothetical protein
MRCPRYVRGELANAHTARSSAATPQAEGR